MKAPRKIEPGVRGMRRGRVLRRVNRFTLMRRRLGVLWPVIAGLTAVAFIFVGGTLAYMFVEEWDLFDSVYMVIISLTTVGYGEVHPLTRAGRAVTAVLLLSGVGTFFYLAGAIVQLMIEGHIQNIFGRRWMRHAIENMRGHTIVCGYGRIGSVVAREIAAEGQDVVVVERSHALVEELEGKDIPFVAGDATKDDILLAAGLKHAKALVSALSEEAANVYVTLTARQLNPEIVIVARSDSPDHSQRLQRAGANQVLFPHLYGGVRMAHSVLRPSVLGFMDLAMRGDNEDLQMEQLTISQGSSLAGKDLIASQLRQRWNVIVIGIQKPDGKLLFNPQPQSVLQAGDTLILVGGKKLLADLQREAAS
ncbi:Voltage-gated potassium channel Kch [Fundidesulfovibrio magnetotacticus]|uniref:Voltage-gated potassium channel Kch n=1 Tax=Fundidesulfovibrio magnetotacticus TaxID=2730080 RepID=A0A6V8LPI9_9BACT|nr:potassium channel protein [Fundidesulfovibrio magnetotacticus]GFK94493.1 Voltage-gated potassium channel Kch [Fundidesulfovibrio magnetotacticus]